MANQQGIDQQIRRLFLTRFVVAFLTIVFVFLVFEFTDGPINDLAYGSFLAGLLVYSAVHIFVGQYIPTRNRHESLLNKYGDVYAVVLSKAMSRYGIGKLIETDWFKTYADEFCERNVPDGVLEPDS